ncbi:hypothetical protein Taro_015619, partial [Colocasia esculenta]|nr:hypothetical protein [Colocasia esculenta]
MAASRRCLGALTRHYRSLLLSSSSHEGSTAAFLHTDIHVSRRPSADAPVIPHVWRSISPVWFGIFRHLSSERMSSSSGEEEEGEAGEDEEDESEDEEGENDGEEEEEGEVLAPKRLVLSGKTDEEKAVEAASIGYKVVSPLDPSERPFKPWEPVFAVVQIGSHQFKVSNGDSIFTERLKFCEVNDKLILTNVLMLGSQTQTIIGRPILPDAAVHAVVEEHALDAKVIIFKKKRRKNYRRTKGHRQELTKLRITDIQGIDKPTK